MTDVADFGAMLTSLRALAELAKLMIDARDAGVVRAKAIELQREIIAAQTGALAAQATQSILPKKVGELEKEVAEFKAWDAERQKYQLAQLRSPGSPGGQTFAYSLKKDVAIAEPEHSICPDCYNDNKKSILQGVLLDEGNVTMLACHRCGLLSSV